jgi:hypothetical protein
VWCSAIGCIVTLTLSMFVALLAADAQPAGKMPRIGVIVPGIPPGASGDMGYAEAGGLMHYGPDTPGSFRRVAVYVDKILKGGQPADLPVEQPTTFELAINRKTAQALGLTLPSVLLFHADKVIQ